MNLDDIRQAILNDIISLYQNSESYETLLELINNGESLEFLLKRYALTYVFCVNNSRVSWSDGKAIVTYVDELANLQKGYELYLSYAKYFLGASVLYPTMDLALDTNLQLYALIEDGKIDYSRFLLQNAVLGG